jgi:type I restriction enzyme S subunit
MKLETFFEKFDRFAEAPGAVSRMRELVLRMATSGRIADQDPSDKSGAEVLKEIFAVRDGLIKRGLAKSRSEGKPIVAGDSIQLPSSWARCMISEVCDLQTGATPSRMENKFFGGDIPWLVSGDINKGEITDCDGRITEVGLEKSNCKIIPPNSVLMALNGQGRTRGTVAILRIPAALNQSLVAMSPYSRGLLLPEYIFWNLRGRYFAIRDITGQDQRRGLNMKLVGQLSLPIPPLAEQKRIVAKVEELMALCDRLEVQQQEREMRHAALARASLARFADAPKPGNLDFLFHNSYSISPADIRRSILALAVRGKLVSQDPNDEPVARLIEQIKAERLRLAKTGKARKSPEVAQLAEAAQPFEIPVSWTWVPLGSVTFIRTGKLDANASSADGQYPFFTCAKEPLRIDQYAYEGECVLLAGNGNFDVNYYDGKFEAYQRTYIIEGVSRYMVDGRYLFRFVQKYADTLREMSVGGVISYIKIGFLTDAPLPLPPLAEQRRIVAKVEQLMALVDALEAQLASASDSGAKLLEAVVSELTKEKTLA